MSAATILHIDMDCFFVSVARLDNPALNGKPVVVAADSARSVVASASYEARRYGVSSAMSVALAKTRCPALIIEPPNMPRYQEMSQRVFDIFADFTPRVEKLSIDEAFLDITGSIKLLGSAEEIAHKLRGVIRSKLNLPCSVGIASQKFVAKIASVKAKPDGICYVPQDKTLEFLLPLPLAKVYGIGPKTAQKLASRAVHTVADARELSLTKMQQLLGLANGLQLYNFVHGIDTRQVMAKPAAKSISKEHTFLHDTTSLDELYAMLAKLVRQVTAKLRADKQIAGSLTIKIRLQDFTQTVKTHKLLNPSANTQELNQLALKLLTQLYQPHTAVRLLGFGVTNLQPAAAAQLALWQPEAAQKWQQIDTAVDAVHKKFQKSMLLSARELQLTTGAEFTQQPNNNQNH